MLTGFHGPADTSAILERRTTLQGICVGPVATLRAAGHVGKIVVTIGGSGAIASRTGGE